MIKPDSFRKLALSFPEATEQPHFEKTSFRIGKKIFATLDVPNGRACLKLSVANQDLFSLFDRSIVFPVPNKWGLQGWTLIELNRIPLDTLTDALHSAYCEVAPKKLVELLKH